MSLEDQTTLLIDPISQPQYKSADEAETEMFIMEDTVLLGTYRVIKMIGSGGMSDVFLVKHIRLGTLWAVKRFDRSRVQDSVFRNEAELLRKLRHPMLPYIVGTHEDEMYFYIIEEYIPGQNLREYMDTHGAVDESIGSEWFLKLCDVLEYLHTRKPPVVYGDMKPSNIMLQPDGELRILDLGISAQRAENSRRIDERADIYSLGVTMCDLLTGVYSYSSGLSAAQIAEKSGISHSIRYILQRCTQANPDDRYSDINELRNDLVNRERLEKSLCRKKYAKWGWILLIGCIGAAALGGMLLITSFKKGRQEVSTGDEMVSSVASTDNSTSGITMGESSQAEEADDSEAGQKDSAAVDTEEYPEEDPEVTAALESLGKAFEEQDEEGVFELIKKEKPILDRYIRIHNYQAILHEYGDKTLIIDTPWYYYGECFNGLPNGEGLAVSYQGLVNTWTSAEWKDGRIEGEFIEKKSNNMSTNAEGTFYLTKERRAKISQGKYKGVVLEEAVYKTAEEVELKQILKSVTPPFSIQYRMEGSQPAALSLDDIPDDVNWINGNRLGSKDVYAFSREQRLLFYVEDYEEYTYAIGVEEDEK